MKDAVKDALRGKLFRARSTLSHEDDKTVLIHQDVVSKACERVPLNKPNDAPTFLVQFELHHTNGIISSQASFHVKPSCQDQILDGMQEMLRDTVADFEDMLVCVDYEGTQRSFDRLRKKASEDMEDWTRRFKLVEEWKGKLDRAGQQMNKMRDAYYKELLHLREQVYQQGKAQEQQSEFHPSYAIHFDPAEFCFEEEVGKIVCEKVAFIRHEFETKLETIEAKHASRISVLTDQLATSKMILDRKEKLTKREELAEAKADKRKVTEVPLIEQGTSETSVVKAVTSADKAASQAETKEADGRAMSGGIIGTTSTSRGDRRRSAPTIRAASTAQSKQADPRAMRRGSAMAAPKYAFAEQLSGVAKSGTSGEFFQPPLEDAPTGAPRPSSPSSGEGTSDFGSGWDSEVESDASSATAAKTQKNSNDGRPGPRKARPPTKRRTSTQKTTSVFRRRSSSGRPGPPQAEVATGTDCGQDAAFKETSLSMSLAATADVGVDARPYEEAFSREVRSRCTQSNIDSLMLDQALGLVEKHYEESWNDMMTGFDEGHSSSGDSSEHTDTGDDDIAVLQAGLRLSQGPDPQMCLPSDMALSEKRLSISGCTLKSSASTDVLPEAKPTLLGHTSEFAELGEDKSPKTKQPSRNGRRVSIALTTEQAKPSHDRRSSMPAHQPRLSLGMCSQPRLSLGMRNRPRLSLMQLHGRQTRDEGVQADFDDGTSCPPVMLQSHGRPTRDEGVQAGFGVGTAEVQIQVAMPGLDVVPFLERWAHGDKDFRAAGTEQAIRIARHVAERIPILCERATALLKQVSLRQSGSEGFEHEQAFLEEFRAIHSALEHPMQLAGDDRRAEEKSVPATAFVRPSFSEAPRSNFQLKVASICAQRPATMPDLASVTSRSVPEPMIPLDASCVDSESAADSGVVGRSSIMYAKAASTAKPMSTAMTVAALAQKAKRRFMPEATSAPSARCRGGVTSPLSSEPVSPLPVQARDPAADGLSLQAGWNGLTQEPGLGKFGFHDADCLRTLSRSEADCLSDGEVKDSENGSDDGVFSEQSCLLTEHAPERPSCKVAEPCLETGAEKNQTSSAGAPSLMELLVLPSLPGKPETCRPPIGRRCVDRDCVSPPAQVVVPQRVPTLDLEPNLRVATSKSGGSSPRPLPNLRVAPRVPTLDLELRSSSFGGAVRRERSVSDTAGTESPGKLRHGASGGGSTGSTGGAAAVGDRKTFGGFGVVPLKLPEKRSMVLFNGEAPASATSKAPPLDPRRFASPPQSPRRRAIRRPEVRPEVSRAA